MARIPDEEIERLKQEVSLERLVTGFGIELRKHGAEKAIGKGQARRAECRLLHNARLIIGSDSSVAATPLSRADR